MINQRRDFIKLFMAYSSLVGCSHIARKPQSIPSRKSRIAIIGGGPAGISTSHFLHENGYTNITLFESTNRLGGKSNTINVEGYNFEMGTVGGAKSYATIKELADRYNVNRLIMPSNGLSHNIDNLNGLDNPVGFKDNLKVLIAYWDYIRDLKRGPYRALSENPGFKNLPEELCVTFLDWMKKNNINPSGLNYFLDYTVTPYGYGYSNEVPAAYILKYFERSFFTSFMKHVAGVKKELFIFEKGYQNLWESIALGLEKRNSFFDIRMSTNINKIFRQKDGLPIQIHTNKQAPEVFDYLILACPHQHTPQFIDDFSSEELKILDKIETYNYHTFAVDTSLDWPTVGILPVNYSRARERHPIFWYRRWPEHPLTIFYAFANSDKISPDEVFETIKSDARQYNWPFNKLYAKRQWEYFPHFKTSDLVDGIYDRLESYQGRKNTYRIGELMSFATVELVSRYSKHLVSSYFSQD